MKILHVAAEMFPLLKTGGLADVVGALPFAQQQLHHADVRLLLPGYPAITAALPQSPIVTVQQTFAGKITLRYGIYNGLGIYIIDAPHLFDRPGNPYHDDNYHDYADNYLRFALLAFIAAELADGMDSWWRPDVVHAHDWHAGLAGVYIKQKHLPITSVFSIHNIAYQGLFAAHHLDEIDLPGELYDVEGLEFHGQLSYLKAGIYYSDQVTTVSPTFAEEITTEACGFGMHGLLQTLAGQNRLSGVLNGIDTCIWNPQHDASITAHYRLGVMQGKARNKVQLQKHFNLSINKNAPLIAMVSRLTEQKGVDVFIESASTIVNNKAQLVILGSGSAELEAAILELAEQYPQQIGAFIGYDEALAHLIIAGSDVIAVPSRFEPCGLTQLYGLKYGTLPLVRHTGGLADTVTDTDDASIKARTATGFVFAEADANSLTTALKRVFALWQRPRHWNQVRANAMRENFDWATAAQKYYNIYAQQ